MCFISLASFFLNFCHYSIGKFIFKVFFLFYTPFSHFCVILRTLTGFIRTRKKGIRHMKKRISYALGVTCAAALLLGGCSSSSTYGKYMTLGEYKGLEVSKIKTEITDDDLEQEISYTLDDSTEYNEADRAAAGRRYGQYHLQFHNGRRSILTAAAAKTWISSLAPAIWKAIFSRMQKARSSA